MSVIPQKEDQAANRKYKGSRGGRPISHDADLYKERNTAERLSAWNGMPGPAEPTPRQGS